MLIILGLLSWILYAGVSWLSRMFAIGVPGVERPVVEVLGLFAGAFACYLLALRVAVRHERQSEILPVIVIFALCFRGTLLFSEPIQEVDIYRYLWDGQTTLVGVSPFRYSPEQILLANVDSNLPEDLAKLVSVRESSPAIKAVLSRVHFGELPTVYPPVSQAVFALSALATPKTVTVSSRIVIMKIFILAFDLATFWLLARLLCFAKKPVGWSLAYAWCPLVLKEFANSGHLDSIAVCLTMLAVFLAVTVLFRKPHRDAENPDEVERNASNKKLSKVCTVFSAVVLGLAVGAKLYPIVLTPLLLITVWRKIGLRAAFSTAGCFLITVVVVCLPIIPREPQPIVADTQVGEIALPKIDQPPAPQDPGRGLKVFLSRWEMNDFLFLLLIENLKPVDQKKPVEEQQSIGQPWFGVVPEPVRREMVSTVSSATGFPVESIPFLLARAVTAGAFVILVFWLCQQSAGSDDVDKFLETIFLTLAWFWLLLPTQNPWYWIWAVSFVPFARGRAWLAMSGLTLLYYLRFWFVYHWPSSSVAFTNYAGAQFFDFVVTWLEYAPWFVWLLVESRFAQRKTNCGPTYRSQTDSML